MLIRVAEALFSDLKDSSRHFIHLHLAATAVRDAGTRTELNLGYEIFQNEFVGLLAAVSLRTNPDGPEPKGLAELVVVVTALVEGFATSWLIDSDQDESLFRQRIAAVIETVARSSVPELLRSSKQ